MKTIFKNGFIHTMESEDSLFSAMEVKDGRISRLFSKEEADRLPKDCSQVVDLKGRHVYPCLIDPHVHMLFTVAVMAAGFNACEITENGIVPSSLSDVGEKIRTFSEKQDKNAVVAINNYIWSSMKERRMPTREELDLWGGGRPLVLYNIDGHSTSLSSAMLSAIGIDPEGHSGILTGEDNERAQGRIADVIGGAVSLPVLSRGIARFENYCAAHGICMVGALEGNADSEKDPTTKLIAFLSRHFRTEVRLYLQYTDTERVKPFLKWMKKKRIGGCGGWEMDGSVGSRSAAFPIAYLDQDAPAPCYYSESEVRGFCEKADREGYQISSHAIGESAIDRLFGALSELPTGRLHRIEHCEFASDETFEKICNDGRFAVVAQPGYSYIDKRYLHTYEDALPASVLSRLKFRSYLERGVILCGSSDSPVQDMDPFLQMAGMVDFYVKEESVTPYEAMKTYTVNAAMAMEEADDYGTLTPGKMASFFTAAEDFFTLSAGEILRFRPEETYLKGVKAAEKTGTVGELLGMLLKKAKKI